MRNKVAKKLKRQAWATGEPTQYWFERFKKWVFGVGECAVMTTVKTTGYRRTYQQLKKGHKERKRR